MMARPLLREIGASDWPIPDGVIIDDLACHADVRGSLTEIFRESWHQGFRPLQWNITRTEARVLRGMHVHRIHTDYIVLIGGAMLLALHDVRPTSLSRGRSALLPLDGVAPKSVIIPPGVAHGFYFSEPSLHLQGVDAYWDGSDEFACRFDCPELQLRWPDPKPCLSAKDRAAGTYTDMVRMFLAGGSIPSRRT
jgi:dTDP-4-dehydrorhamnose 3,5-epimerase